MNLLVIQNADGSYEIGNPNPDLKEIQYVLFIPAGDGTTLDTAKMKYVPTCAQALYEHVSSRYTALQMIGSKEDQEGIGRLFPDPRLARMDVPESLVPDLAEWPATID